MGWSNLIRMAEIELPRQIDEYIQHRKINIWEEAVGWESFHLALYFCKSVK